MVRGHHDWYDFGSGTYVILHVFVSDFVCDLFIVWRLTCVVLLIAAAAIGRKGTCGCCL
jgi:hypothetical protein